MTTNDEHKSDEEFIVLTDDQLDKMAKRARFMDTGDWILVMIREIKHRRRQFTKSTTPTIASHVAGPFSIGSTIWPGISKLIEESGEVCQIAGKLIATGGDAEHWDGSNLRSRLEEEIADLQAACRFVVDANGLNSSRITERSTKKRDQFATWHLEQKTSGFKDR